MIAHHFFPMQVANMGFFLERLHDDCAHLQFLRELTQNSIESIEAVKKQSDHLKNEPDYKGKIFWEVDWTYYELMEVFKLSIIDNGIGMTGEEMVKYINYLSSSIHEQGRQSNFGVGAKIAAAPLNPHGLVYLSWKDGQGYMIKLYKDDQVGSYGLERFESGEFWQKVSNEAKPKDKQGKELIEQHGTAVIFLGKDENHDTMQFPGTSSHQDWVFSYLNSKYFRLPDGIEMKVREAWDKPRKDKYNFFRTLQGYESWLNDNTQEKGVLELEESKATAHWWILKESASSYGKRERDYGHVAALYKNEIYEAPTSRRGAYKSLQPFGVIFGADRVVIYIEPHTKNQDISTDTARTRLIIGKENLDWGMYANEFSNNTPEEIREYQDAIVIGDEGSEDRKKNIERRLESIKELFKFGRYRKKRDGKSFIHEGIEGGGNNPTPSKGGARPEDGQEGPRGKGRRKKTGVYELFAQNEGINADLLNIPDIPDTKWISTDDNTRQEFQLENAAAEYVPNKNLLLINADFCIFQEMVERWSDKYSAKQTKSVITDTMREWFGQQLIETVMSALALKQSGKFSQEEILEQLLSEKALTAAILARYHIDERIKRSLGSRFGAANAA